MRIAALRALPLLVAVQCPPMPLVLSTTATEVPSEPHVRKSEIPALVRMSRPNTIPLGAGLVGIGPQPAHGRLFRHASTALQLADRPEHCCHLENTAGWPVVPGNLQHGVCCFRTHTVVSSQSLHGQGSEPCLVSEELG